MADKQSKKTTTRYSISLTPRNHEQLLAMSKEIGYASLSEAVRGCIHIAFNKTFPPYKTAKNVVDGVMAVSEEEAEEMKEAKKEAQAEADAQNLLNEQIRVCEQDLNGVVLADNDGNPTDCSFFQYSRVNRTLQSCGLNQVQGMKDLQYHANKQHIEDVQKGGRAKYDTDETVEQVLAQE
jgi:hypothetical protein